ncbi:tetratricopeptide repeat protein [Sporolactobacillus sp. THM7-4]|nr:tetratricopeptide repeat protein [Sporolactobacillus sp. THM7-4]
MMKKNRRTIRGKGKILLLPDLEDRLQKKAMSFVKEKRYNEARYLFGKMLQLNEFDLKGLYGWAICSVEMGEYQEAEKAVVRLLHEETSYRDDVFRLYLTILIEKKDYHRALLEIDRAMKQKKISNDLHAFLNHLKRFCELRIDEPGAVAEHETDPAMIRHSGPERTASPEPIDWSIIEQNDPENQLLAIKSLAHQLTKENLPEIERFLLDKRQKAGVKTMLMCLVKEENLADEIAVYKFGKVYHAVLDSPNFLHKAFADQMEEQIERVLSSENPTLAQLAVNIGRFFTMNVYPAPIDPPSAMVWACTFAIRAASAGEMEEGETEKLRELFGVSEEDIERANRMYHEFETDEKNNA